MQTLVKHIFYLFAFILLITFCVCIGGLVYIWQSSGSIKDLPYIGTLITIVIADAIGIIYLAAKKGLGYLPDTYCHKTSSETNVFMEEFIRYGSSIIIVSNRVGWLKDAPKVMNKIIERSNKGVKFEIITAEETCSEIKSELQKHGVKFLVTKEHLPPEARFTLIDMGRSGAEKLAIAKGCHPKHEITVFDSNSGPQIIGLAKDIVSKSKEIINARTME